MNITNNGRQLETVPIFERHAPDDTWIVRSVKIPAHIADFAAKVRKADIRPRLERPVMLHIYTDLIKYGLSVADEIVFSSCHREIEGESAILSFPPDLFAEIETIVTEIADGDRAKSGPLKVKKVDVIATLMQVGFDLVSEDVLLSIAAQPGITEKAKPGRPKLPDGEKGKYSRN